MNVFVILGVTIVNLALISYSIGIITEQRKHRITPLILRFLMLGLTFDLTATICMLVGAYQGLFTRHSLLGYSCLLGMAIDTALVSRHRSKYGDQEVPRALHLYSRYAYLWWVAGAYILGGFLAFMRVKLRLMGG